MNLLQKIIKKSTFFLKRFLAFSLSKKILFVILSVGIVWLLVVKIVGQQTNQPQYQTETATRGTLVVSISASGTVSSGGNASIATQATGIVSEVFVKNGDYVNQGDSVATLTLDQTSLQKQQAAYANYLSAQNMLNTAKNQMNALQAALFEANQKFVTDKGTNDPDTDDPSYVIERANWLKAETDYTSQKDVIAQAEVALSSAWLLYAQTSSTITAPISGYISNLTITSGLPLVSSSNTSSSSTTTSSSQTIGSITLENAQTTTMVNLTEIDVTHVKVGQKATLTLDAFPNKTFTGKVSAVNTTGVVSSGVTTYPTTITFDTAPENIYPNMAVAATIITDIKNDVVMIPTSAIQTQNDTSFIRVFKNGQVEQVGVETGVASDTQTEIISGLTEGELVVTGTTSTQPGTTQGASPFGGSGFGGRSVGGGSGQRVFIQR